MYDLELKPSIPSCGLLWARACVQDCMDTAAAADQPEEIPICEREFANSLVNLVAALRRCSAAGIPDLAAEAVRAIEAVAKGRSIEIDRLSDSPADSSDTDGCRNRYAPRRDPEEVFRHILEWARPLQDVIRARGSVFQLRSDMDEAAALNRQALDDLGQLFGASVYPACTRLQLEQCLGRLHAELRVYGNGDGCERLIAPEAMLLHASWRETYTRAKNNKRYRARSGSNVDSASPGSTSQREFDAASAAEAAIPAAAALATAVAVHAGSGAGETLDHAAVAAETLQSLPAAAAGAPAGGKDDDEDSYSSYSYSYYSSSEPAPAGAEAGASQRPATAPRAADARRQNKFMRRERARRAAAKRQAVKRSTASRSAGAAAAAASKPAMCTAVATAAVERALGAAAMNPSRQAAPKHAAAAKAKPKPAAEAAVATCKSAAAAAAAAPRPKALKRKPAAAAQLQRNDKYTTALAKLLRDPNFKPDLDNFRPELSMAQRRFAAAVAQLRQAAAASPSLPAHGPGTSSTRGCSKCRYIPNGCSACR